MPAASTDTALLDAAFAMLEDGCSLLPVDERKRPHRQALLDTGFEGLNAEGERTHSWERLTRRPPTEDELEAWFARPGRGLALVTGAVSGRVVLDYDGEHGAALAVRLGAAPHGRSGGGGLHQHLRHPGHRVATLQSEKNSKLSLIRGLDIRGDGGYVVVPPSEFGERRYRWLRDFRDLDGVDCLPQVLEYRQDDGKAATCNPRALLTLERGPELSPELSTGPDRPWPGFGENEEAILAAGRELLFRALTKAHAGEGRNNSGAWLAMALRDHRFSAEQATAVMRAYQQQVPDTDGHGALDPYTWEEARASLSRIMGTAPRSGWLRLPPAQVRFLEELERRWPDWDEATRQQAGRCLLAVPQLRDEAAALIGALGGDAAGLAAGIDAARAAGRAVPGLNSLARLLGLR